MGQTNEALTVDHAHALEISARALQAGYEDILTPAALNFVERLAARFGGEVEARLAARKQRQARIDAGEGLDFLAETREIRESEWRIAPIPEDILDRRVEITGPPTRMNSFACITTFSAAHLCVPIPRRSPPNAS